MLLFSQKKLKPKNVSKKNYLSFLTNFCNFHKLCPSIPSTLFLEFFLERPVMIKTAAKKRKIKNACLGDTSSSLYQSNIKESVDSCIGGCYSLSLFKISTEFWFFSRYSWSDSASTHFYSYSSTVIQAISKPIFFEIMNN